MIPGGSPEEGQGYMGATVRDEVSALRSKSESREGFFPYFIYSHIPG